MVRKMDSPPETDNGREPWEPETGVDIRTVEEVVQVGSTFVSTGELVIVFAVLG